MDRLAWAALALVLLAPQTLPLSDVLIRASEHVRTFHDGFRAIIADEEYVQILRSYGVRSGDANIDGEAVHRGRRTRSEFALLTLPGSDEWLGFRDTFEVDGKPVGNGKGRRLERVILDSPETALAEARRLLAESARYNIGSPRTLNVPTFGLMPLMAGRQQGYLFAYKGQKKIGADTIWVVSYDEVQRPTQVKAPDGSPVPMHGEFYIEPTTGRVVRTLMRTDGYDAGAYADRPGSYVWVPRIELEVTYALEPKLKVWVPVQMKELYERSVELLTCTASYSNFRRFETSVRILPPK